MPAALNPWDANPFALLTFIAAPAILTNASSVMALGTSNRFARAVDRARALGRAESRTDPAVAALRDQQMTAVSRRVLLLVRALTAFYLSVGAFATASLVSLLGAVAVVAQQPELRIINFAVALIVGVAGVGGLVTRSAILVWESRLTLRPLREELALQTGHPPPV
jgi:hypothetical protein